MDDLVKEFIEETVESLSELDMDLIKLEQDPENEELLGNIFRLMHTIKGTCGFLGLPRLEKTAHAAENLLDLLRGGKMPVTELGITVLLMSIDRVRYLVSEIEKNGQEPNGDDQDIISQIEQVIADGSGAASASNPELEPEQETAVEDSTDKAPQETEAAAPQPVEDKAEVSATPAVTTPPSPPPVEEEKSDNNAAAKATTSKDKSPEFLKVQMSVLENLINMVSELVLTRNQLLQFIELDEDSDAYSPLQRLTRIVSDLQEGVMKTRMQPIGNAWAKLPRIIRDLSKDLGKKVNLEMHGEDTELDRQVLEMIKDPLTHMVRNSCDHGIEMPADRAARGKPETGTVKLSAYHEGGFIIVEIADDGKGIDAKVIGQKAVEKGLITPDKLESLNDKQLLMNIFKPGFSTAEQVTNVSGRGVGMDVVRTNIEKIGGTIDMESTPGQGSVFRIQIPLTLAIISALIVEIDGIRYALPQLNIQELVRAHSSDHAKIEKINDKLVYRLRDRILPLIDSRTLFDGFVPDNFSANAQPLEDLKSEIENGNKLIVVVAAGTSYFGLVVDNVMDMEEIVIKSISSVLQDTKIFAGNTILGDGEVIMIMDPAGIARKFEVNNDSSKADGEALTQQINMRISETASMLVFNAGGETPKAMPLALISRLQRFDRSAITRSGGRMIVAHDDELMPLQFADDSMTLPVSGEVTTLILSDDASEASTGIVIDEVIDIMEDHLDLNTSTARDGIIGSVRLKDNTVDVIDIAHFLNSSKQDFFSQHAHMQTPYAVDDGSEMIKVDTSNRYKSTDGKTRVLIVDDSAFFRNMLKPILVSAGFDVTTSEDPIEAGKLHDSGQMFDIILSDIEMPHMNGYEFVEKMKMDSDWKSTPFIAITSHTTPQDIEFGYKKGFSKYIGKFDKDELLRTMKTVLAA